MTAGYPPSGSAVESFGACLCRCREPHARTPRLIEDTAGTFEKRSGNAATFVGLVDEQCPDAAVARIGGGKAGDPAVLDPDEDAWMVGEPAIVFQRDPRRVTKHILAHPIAYFHEARDVRAGRFANQEVHRWLTEAGGLYHFGNPGANRRAGQHFNAWGTSCIAGWLISLTAGDARMTSACIPNPITAR
jgi:hypothetical protein